MAEPTKDDISRHVTFSNSLLTFITENIKAQRVQNKGNRSGELDQSKSVEGKQSCEKLLWH